MIRDGRADACKECVQVRRRGGAMSCAGEGSRAQDVMPQAPTCEDVEHSTIAARGPRSERALGLSFARDGGWMATTNTI